MPMCLPHASRIHDDFAQYWKRTMDVGRTELANELEANVTRLDAGQDPTPGAPVPGWVYYLKMDDLIKIGYAASVRHRMRAYPPNAELLAVEPGTPKLEKARHSLFHVHLARGREWFHLNPELDDWIRNVICKYGPPDDHRYQFGTPDVRRSA